MHYVIIAAGEGSRLRQEGIGVPKPLLRIGGSTLLGRLIEMFRRQPDCTGVSVAVSPEVEAYALREYEDAVLKGADNVVVASTPGSMHSFHKLIPYMRDDERYCLTTVDTVFAPEEFDRFMKAYREDTSADGYMGVTTYADDEKPLYVASSADGDITGFFDTPAEGVKYVSGGIYGLGKNSMDILEDCITAGKVRMREFQRALIGAGMRLKAYPFSIIIDVDHASDIKQAEALINKTTLQH